MTLTNAILGAACVVLNALAIFLGYELIRERRRPVRRGPTVVLAGPAPDGEAAPPPPPDMIPPAGGDRAAFLAVLSHEIRTPLNGIIGLASVLLEHPLGQTERHYVRIIQESGNHLLSLINDILDYTRLNAGRLELTETAFDVRGVIRGAVDLLANEAATKQLSLTVDIADDVPRRAGGDPARLRQILLNLVGNGLKFTRKGGVTLEVTRGPTEPGGVRIGFAVSDTGIGIAPEAIGKLFAEFSQVDASISRRFGGSGLGLVICKRLIERMGGSISVESRVGHGSVFRFDILLRARRASDEAGPRAEPAANAATAAAPATTALAGGVLEEAAREGRPRAAFKVLVAEDNATNRLVATRMLERIGHTVEVVPDGRQAVEAVQSGTFDLVLMDLMMPEMDGLAATAAIRALDGQVSKIPIVGLTAADSHGDETACRAAGMNHFATKPITAARLAEAIATATSGRTPLNPAAPRVAMVENRTFDPAVLDDLVRELGQEVAAEVVRMFIDNAEREIAAMRDLVGRAASTEAALIAYTMSNTARSVGLLRVGRAASDMSIAGLVTAEQVGMLEALLWTGLEELRMWRP